MSALNTKVQEVLCFGYADCQKFLAGDFLPNISGPSGVAANIDELRRACAAKVIHDYENSTIGASNDIKLIGNKDNRNLSDLELINEFYEFLQGEVPKAITLGRGSKVKLSKKKAFTIIWYLQEHFSILPSKIDQCDVCGDLFDSHASGYYSEKQGKNFCGFCDTYHNEEEEA